MPVPKLDRDLDGEGPKHNMRIPDDVWDAAMERMTKLRRKGYGTLTKRPDGGADRRTASVALAVRQELERIGGETEEQTIRRLKLVKVDDPQTIGLFRRSRRVQRKQVAQTDGPGVTE